jgi:CheY-like chemotaxis protein
MSTPPGNGHAGLRVLVVDDDELCRYVIARRLQRWGFEPVVFERAAEALRYLSAEPARAVISDLYMPESDGLTLARTVKRMHPHLPVLLMTASPDSSLQSRAREAGVSALITKQAGEDIQLRAALERLLADPNPDGDSSLELAHSLRTPLTALKSAIDLLCSGEMPETQRRFAGIAQRNVDQMIVLVERLLEAAARP